MHARTSPPSSVSTLMTLSSRPGWTWPIRSLSTSLVRETYKGFRPTIKFSKSARSVSGLNTPLRRTRSCCGWRLSFGNGTSSESDVSPSSSTIEPTSSSGEAVLVRSPAWCMLTSISSLCIIRPIEPPSSSDEGRSPTGRTYTSISSLCVIRPRASRKLTTKYDGTCEIKRVSASPLTTHCAALGFAELTLHVDGLPGSGSPRSETEIDIEPEVVGLYLHVYVPSPWSMTLARTRVPSFMHRMATKKVSPPLTWRVPVSSQATM
mmetsp:Transcript_13844/g.27867  ORF Transcript_13844/g.27867 Transcript_13844/m.27867 type:complete len:264 (+) Transcript_13844:114-905(+)